MANLGYEKINWKDSSETLLNAENLNHMDEGIYEAHERITANADEVEKNEVSIAELTKEVADNDKKLQGSIDLLSTRTVSNESSIASLTESAADSDKEIQALKTAQNKTTQDLAKKADNSNTVITGSLSMGRKAGTTIGAGSTALGENATASGSRAHAEGLDTEAQGNYSHAEGNDTHANGVQSHTEGRETKADGVNAHAEGYQTNATGYASHTEGQETEAEGAQAHAEGLKNKSTGNCSHTEGRENTATGKNAHAEGYKNTASGDDAHVEGYITQATANNSHAEGHGTIAKKARAHAEGHYTIAASNQQHVQGRYNIEDNKGTYAHIVGNGLSATDSGTGKEVRSNAHTLDWQGNAWYQGSVTSNGADYAEFFEWLDKNLNKEDRVGLIVTLDGEQIKPANSGDDILGIVSGTAAVLGDNYECSWNGKYLTDNFGRIIYDEVEEFEEFTETIIEEVTNEETEEVELVEREEKHTISLGTFKHPRMNPDYDPEQAYVNRANRPEWDTVGMIGKLYVRDDGTCEANGYATVGTDGIATASAERTNMRVLSRVSDDVVRVLLK